MCGELSILNIFYVIFIYCALHIIHMSLLFIYFYIKGQSYDFHIIVIWTWLSVSYEYYMYFDLPKNYFILI